MAKGSYISKSPLIIPGCIAWFDMSDISSTNMISSGGLVSKVMNKVKGGNNLQQATSSAQPKNNTRTINGLPVLEFAHDGTRNDIMMFDSNDLVDQPFTVVLMAQSDTHGTSQSFMGRQTSSIAGQWVLLRNDSYTIFQSYLFGAAAGDSGSTQPSNNNPNIYTVWFQDGDKLNFKLNNNTATQGATRSGYDNAVTTPLALGGSNGNSNSSASLDGVVGELIIYNRVLTSNEITQINRYLSNKWGISIS